jgi:hypothetical protein
MAAQDEMEIEYRCTSYISQKRDKAAFRIKLVSGKLLLALASSHFQFLVLHESLPYFSVINPYARYPDLHFIE